MSAEVDKMKSLKLKAEIEELYSLNEFVKDLIQKEDFQVNLILEEVFANIVNYSSSDSVKFNAKFEYPLLTMEFIDNGIEFNPLSEEDPEMPENIEDAQIGGLGIFLTKKMADELEYDYIDGENHLKILKKIE